MGGGLALLYQGNFLIIPGYYALLLNHNFIDNGEINYDLVSFIDLINYVTGKFSSICHQIQNIYL